MLPKTYCFVDVFGGSMAVLLNRPPCNIDTYNDVDKNVVNFFKVLREQPETIIKALELTPHSRLEYENAIITSDDDEIERARKFFVRTVQSQFSAGNMENKKGWRAAISESRTGISEATSKYLNSVSGLFEIVDRLRGVQIENRDFRWIFDKYNNENTLLYLDPPYYGTHRSTTKYLHEMTDQDYIDLGELTKTSKSKVAVSGYSCDFIDGVFSHLKKHVGPVRKNGLSIEVVRECLWTNYDIEHRQKQLF